MGVKYTVTVQYKKVKKAVLSQRKPCDSAVNYYGYQAVVCFVWYQGCYMLLFYEGRPVNKLLNGIIVLDFKI